MEVKKQKRRLIITIALLVILLAGYTIYNRLSSNKASQISNTSTSLVLEEESSKQEDSSKTQTTSSSKPKSSQENTESKKDNTKDENKTKQDESASKDKNDSKKDNKSTDRDKRDTKTKRLSKEEVLQGLTINYIGDNKEAKAEVSLKLDEPYDSLQVELADDYKAPLSNGDEFSVVLTKESKKWLKDHNVEVEGDGKYTITVEGLEVLMPFTSDIIKSATGLKFTGYNGDGEVDLSYKFNEPFTKLSLYIQSKSTDLSNGDIVTVSLTPESLAFLEDSGYRVEDNGKVDFEVKDLKEAEMVSKDLIEKHLVINFTGTSGAGSVKLDTTFQPPYSEFLTPESFKAENDGKIKNNDEVTITITKECQNKLLANGYKLEDGAGQITKKVEGLKEVAQTASDIKNIKEIDKKIEENIKSKYPDSVFGAYEITLEDMYYRPFHADNDLLEVDKATGDGTYIHLYSIKAYDRNKKKLKRTSYLVSGYTDMFIDEEKNVNLEKIIDYYYEFDQDYTLESVTQLLTGYGFEKNN